MGFPPSAFLIGAQKAGTTTLANLIGQHPDVSLAEPKEPDYLSNQYHRSLAWYQDKFIHPEAEVLLDASTSYTIASPTYEYGDKSIPERLYELNPEAKLVYIMRDPVERTYSGYLHSKRYGRTTQSFSALIRNKEFHHIYTSDYYRQINRWLEVFPRGSLLLLLFEDLKEQPEATARQCLEFLGLESKVEIKTEVYMNKSYNTTGFGAKVNGLLRKYRFINIRWVPAGLRRMLKNRLILSKKPVEKMSTEDRVYLQKHFQPMNERLKQEYGVNTDKWN
ncbi:sulfotransferase family protein [Marinococcus halophilus]|uniref:sulfotransferase family protein n=1 Tax=Marinococcus halophilus TaxID=1371 RepID=UPI0009A5E60B|nr:sulfotransferase [Marinococcus halophilus]